MVQDPEQDDVSAVQSSPHLFLMRSAPRGLRQQGTNLTSVRMIEEVGDTDRSEELCY